MNLRTVGAWITAGAAFWVSLGSLDVAANGEQVVRVAMLPSLAQLAACVALALAIGAALGVRLSDAPRAVPGSAGAGPKRAGSGDSFRTALCAVRPGHPANSSPGSPTGCRSCGSLQALAACWSGWASS